MAKYEEDKLETYLILSVIAIIIMIIVFLLK